MYEELWRDPLGTPHDTGQMIQQRDRQPYLVAYWRPYSEMQEEGLRAEDVRIRGPAITTFPQNIWMEN